MRACKHAQQQQHCLAGVAAQALDLVVVQMVLFEKRIVRLEPLPKRHHLRSALVSLVPLSLDSAPWHEGARSTPVRSDTGAHQTRHVPGKDILRRSDGSGRPFPWATAFALPLCTGACIFARTAPPAALATSTSSVSPAEAAAPRPLALSRRSAASHPPHTTTATSTFFGLPPLVSSPERTGQHERAPKSHSLAHST